MLKGQDSKISLMPSWFKCFKNCLKESDFMVLSRMILAAKKF